MGGKNFSYSSVCFDEFLNEYLIKKEKELIKKLSDKYYQDIENAIKLQLEQIGVQVESLRKGDIKQIIPPNNDSSSFYFDSTLLFHLHFRSNVAKYEGWEIEFPKEP
jgi:hypothetical protein